MRHPSTPTVQRKYNKQGTRLTTRFLATVPLLWQLRQTCWLARLLYIEISCPNFHLMFTDAFNTSSCEPNAMWLWGSALKSPLQSSAEILGVPVPPQSLAENNSMRRVTPAQQHNKKQNTTPWHRQWGLAVGAVGYGPVKFFSSSGEPRDLGCFGLVLLHQVQRNGLRKPSNAYLTDLYSGPKLDSLFQ